MKKILYKLKFLIVTAFLSIAFTSCLGDLDTEPLDKTILTSDKAVNDTTYVNLLAKCYAGLAIGGQTGVDGEPDISSINGGFSSFLRQLWNAQELTTDEYICAWGDVGLPELHSHEWNTQNQFITALYYRINLEITYCNNLLKLTEGNTNAKIVAYRNEARFLRALAHYYGLDLFGKIPFVTEKDPIGTKFFPKQLSTKKEYFDYIETELKYCGENLPKTNEYGRANRAAAWSVLSKLYLNAKVYLGLANDAATVSHYTNCISYCKKVMDDGYTLEDSYKNLFLADNNLCTNEIIFPVCYDGTHTQTWGGMTFLICSCVGEGMTAADYGINGGWGGNRTTKAFVSLFSDITGATDTRASFATNAHTLEIEIVSAFSNGYGMAKFVNKKRDGSAASNGGTTSFPDCDFPLLRLGDVYLMFAEAILRGGTGATIQDGKDKLNALRNRAYKNSSLNDAVWTLEFILNERGRELYSEAQRRTDLIRFGKFTGDTYLWPWKGGVKNGRAIAEKLAIFPIPSADINSNTNLVQNTGY